MGLTISSNENQNKVPRKVKWAEHDEIREFNVEEMCFDNNNCKIDTTKKCLKPILKHRTNCVIVVYDAEDV